MAKRDGPEIHLEKMGTTEILRLINGEDKKVPEAVGETIDTQIAPLVEVVIEKLKRGGRLIYIGAGTSGRLGVLDASEIPPTFDSDVIIGLIAGGYGALLKAAEGAEDNVVQGWKDLKELGVSPNDIVVGIAASGTTPYVDAALTACRCNGILTGCIVCCMDTPIARRADYPIEVDVGEEIVKDSTRLKAGTAQKLVLNMISTTVMAQLGKVRGQDMICMRPSNAKLRLRAIKMIVKWTDLSEAEAMRQLDRYGNAKGAIEAYERSALCIE